MVTQAFKAMQAKDCTACMEAYQNAFRRSKHSALSHLRAARCASMCGEALRSDQLVEAAAEINWDETLQILNSPKQFPELAGAPNDNFVEKAKVTATKTAECQGIDFGLMHRLAAIREADQWYRANHDSVRSAFGSGSPQHKQFLSEWVHSDSMNMVEIEKLFHAIGYPGKSLVGPRQASTAWLVLQHAPLDKQEKWLPLIAKAADTGECLKADWAYLLDRVRMRKNQPQVYGSQVVRDTSGGWVLHPIEDEANVDARRAAVGLGPLEAYAERCGVSWKPPVKKE
jgi:hypothetical protein